MLRTAVDKVSAAATGLRIQDLSKRFDRTAVLDGVDLDVAPGDLVTVLGPSGSGKTTLLRLICGFERANRGRIELGGRVVADAGRMHLPPEKRGVGYVAQEGALFPHMNVQDNILFGLPRKLRKAPRTERARRVSELLRLMDLPPQYAARSPAALSGGEQQRVALARALAPQPAVVLLDEPFSALDAGLRADTRMAVLASLKQVGATALLVTHDQDEALSMGDKVAVLQHGRLVQVASPQAVYRFPVNPETARFVGEAVLVAGKASAGTVDCCFGRLPLAKESCRQLHLNGAEQEVDVMIRPEQFRLYRNLSDMRPGGGRLQAAKVEQMSFYGHDARIALRLDQGPRFSASAPGIGLPEIGQSVGVHVIGPVIAYPRQERSDEAGTPADSLPGNRSEKLLSAL